MKRLVYLILIFTLTYTAFYYHRDIIKSLSAYRDTTQHPERGYIIQPHRSRFLEVPTPVIPSPLLTKKVVKSSPGSVQPEEEWGRAKEIGEGTYTIRVGNDAAMGAPQEILAALNSYRNVNGRSTLTWDDTLATYAQSRADYMAKIKTTDKHAGFNNFLKHEDGFSKLGFYRLGENSYYGGSLNGVHLIEWVFAKSPGHDANQKDNVWSHVGIGVTNTTVDLIFGGNKM